MIDQGVSIIRNDLPNNSLERTGDSALRLRDSRVTGSWKAL